MTTKPLNQAEIATSLTNHNKKQHQSLMTQKAQAIVMKNDPILGTTYQLEEVEYINESHKENIDCKHSGKQLIHIGDRNYCSTCGDFVNNPINNK